MDFFENELYSLIILFFSSIINIVGYLLIASLILLYILNFFIFIFSPHIDIVFILLLFSNTGT
jgi:hypothetical protein